jgi:hypothetical protein
MRGSLSFEFWAELWEGQNSNYIIFRNVENFKNKILWRKFDITKLKGKTPCPPAFFWCEILYKWENKHAFCSTYPFYGKLLKNIQHISTKFHIFEIWRNFPIKRVYATKMCLFSHLCNFSHHKRSVGIGFLSSILWYWKFSNLSPNKPKKLVKFKLAKKKKSIFFGLKNNMQLPLCNKDWDHLMCLSYF